MEQALAEAPEGQISLTDPDARAKATSARRSGLVGYNAQAAVDTETHLIVTHDSRTRALIATSWHQWRRQPRQRSAATICTPSPTRLSQRLWDARLPPGGHHHDRVAPRDFRQPRITRWEHEHLVDEMRQRLSRDPDSMTLRSCTVEHPFTIKAQMGATHFQMRRLKNVRTEMTLHVLAYNIKRMIALVGVSRSLAAILS